MKISAADRALFDRLLRRMVEEDLPPDFREELKQIPVLIEDEPPPHILEEFGIDPGSQDADLCGLHWGIPLDERSITESSFEPNAIFLYRGPIFRLVEWDAEELEEQIWITLLHELGHHFGLSEEDLEELGYD